MYSLTFMYPSGVRAFDVDHFLKVHLPLGLSLTEKHFGFRPLKLFVQIPMTTGDGTGEAARYGALSSVVFETEAQVLTFSRLFEVEEAARLLSEDFPNYTAGPPAIMIAKVIEIDDVDSVIGAYRPGAKQSGAARPSDTEPLT